MSRFQLIPRRWIAQRSVALIALAVLWLGGLSTPALVLAQDAPDSPLVAESVEIIEMTDDYGQVVEVAQGILRNTSDNAAYTNITLNAEAYRDDGTLIAEGFGGVLVNACGVGLVYDFTLQPGAAQPFTLPLEVFESGAIARVEVLPQADLAPQDGLQVFTHPAITQAAPGEVVEVEWRGPRSLRFGAGCGRDLFTEWNWQTLNLLTGQVRPAEHPRAAAVDDELRANLSLTDPAIFENSFIRFDPYGERMVYQDAVNRFYSADADGRFLRLIHAGLNSYSLQGVYWLGEERFLAYYYGAYGDPVIYFTADAQARQISPPPLTNYRSAITPGASRDGRRVVVAGDFEDGAGYYLHVVTNGFFEKLFDGDYPGNNYPSPLPFLTEENGEVRVNRVLVARDVAGVPTLQCFNRDEGVLYELAPLPLLLDPGDHAQWWLSPDEATIALAADGAHGGLWLINRAELPPCEGDAPTAETTAEATEAP